MHSNFLLRILSSVIALPCVLYAIYDGSYIYMALLFVVFTIALYEWISMPFAAAGRIAYNAGGKSAKRRAIIAYVEYLVFGLLMLLSFASSLIYIRSFANGFSVLLWMLLVVWSTDIFAYIGGNIAKGARLAPKISPGKRWSGFIIGIVSAVIVSYYARELVHELMPYRWSYICVAVVLSLLVQVGDLYESFVKRKYGVKDSGNIIPGHGGMLDRIDGLIFASIFFATYIRLCG